MHNIIQKHTRFCDKMTQYQDRDIIIPYFAFFPQLHIAAANGYTDVVVFLLFCHVLVDIEDDETWQPIHAAAYWGHVSMTTNPGHVICTGWLPQQGNKKTSHHIIVEEKDEACFYISDN